MTTINPLCKFSPSTPPSSYEDTVPFDVTLGYQFSLLANKTINALGLYYPSGGFSQSYVVKLWDSNATEIVSASIPVGVCTNLVDSFCWVSIPDTPLAGNGSGVSYRISAYYPLNDQSLTDNFVLHYPLSALQIVEPSTTFNGGYGEFGDAYPIIPESTTGTASYFGPNVGFKSVVIPVYEPPFVPLSSGQLWPA